MPRPEELLPGRTQAVVVPESHFVTGHRMQSPFPGEMAQAVFGLGCFWGAERCFWQLPGVYVTAVGYAGGGTPNPTYEEVCSGLTGHVEVVWVAFDARAVSYNQLLETFWQAHNPTQGMRQGNDLGTQYRSIILTYDPDQQALAESSCDAYQQALTQHGQGRITTQIEPAGPFYYAEAYHQQYLAKNPGGYCGLGGTGVEFSSKA